MDVEVENYQITAADEYNNIIDYRVYKKTETRPDYELQHIKVLDDEGVFYGVTVEREKDISLAGFVKKLIGQDPWHEEVEAVQRTSYDRGMEKGSWEDRTLEDFREFLEGSDGPVEEIMP